MIYTITLNPSIDYVVKIDQVIMGITNRSSSEEYFFGGKGINVSRVLAQLDIASTALGFVAGFTGDAIEKGISDPHISSDFIKLKKGISRINVKIKAECETEINGQGPEISGEELEALMKKLDCITDGDILVLAGSIPGTLPDNIYENILKKLQHKNVRIIVDATGNLLLNSLKYNPFLIKPNKQEISELFNTDIRTKEDTIHYAKKLQTLGARNVLVSLGSEGALLLDEKGEVHESGVINLPIVTTVGSGDSMIAGFIAGYEKTGSYKYSLYLGSICGNATAFLPGLATKEKINELMNFYPLN